MIKTASINFDPKMTDTHALEEYSVKDWNLVTVKVRLTVGV